MKKIFVAMALFAGLSTCGLYAEKEAGPVSVVKEEEAGPVPVVKEELAGLVHTLESGEFFNISIQGKRFVIDFYDAEGLPVAPLYDRAIIRYEGILDKEEEGVMPCKSDGKRLSGIRPLYPPHAFWIYVTLKKGTGDGEERYVVKRSRLQM